MSPKKKKKGRGFLVTVFLLALVFGAGLYLYQKFFATVSFGDRSYTYFYVEHGDDFNEVTDNLEDEGIIKDKEAFTWLAERMKLAENIHPGRYRITNGMGLRHVINLLKYNRQEKVKLSYNTQIRNLDEFVKYNDEKLELDDSQLEELLFDGEKLHNEFGLDPASAFALVRPGAFEVSWAITAEELFGLLKAQYLRTWNAQRVAKAAKLGFSPAEVMTLASIVQSESGIATEQRKIAGVYINRLQKNMPLQADPTLKFANKTYDAQRVLDADKAIDSPYNTYRYRGLPPGPICLVNNSAVDATLNYERHGYLYFCAKPELNGYSNYSSTYTQHQLHASAYRRALNRLGITR
jgi:UPF0755 protein